MKGGRTEKDGVTRLGPALMKTKGTCKKFLKCDLNKGKGRGLERTENKRKERKVSKKKQMKRDPSQTLEKESSRKSPFVQAGSN